MKLAILTANLGKFEPQVEWAKQIIPGVDITVKRFTDENFPPRITLHPRVQSHIPKYFGWEMEPGYDCYLWVDSSRGLLREDAAEWFYKHAQGVDMVLFKHPQRNTVKQEADFVRVRMNKPYLKSRYGGDLLEEQLAAIPKEYPDNKLYASTAFFYWNRANVRDMMKEWWFYTTRYHALDQLVLPYLVWEHNIKTKELDEDVYHCEYIPMMRK